MRVAVIGSRGLEVHDLENYLPEGTTCIVSGGARGVDACAHRYAVENGVDYVEYLPDYARYGRRAPLLRNEQIVKNADVVLAFWDGRSRGTAYTIKYAQKLHKETHIFTLNNSIPDA